MKRNLIVVGVLALTGGWVLAQPQEPPYDFKDLKGNLRLWNTTTWNKEDDDDGNSTLRASGSPVKIESKTQGLLLDASRITAFLKNQGKGQLALEWADLEGGVDVNQSRTTNDGKVTRKLTTEKVRLEEGATSATTKLLAAFTMVDTLDPVAGIRPRTITMKGSGGTIVTTSYQQQRESDIRSADLRGATVILGQGILPGEAEPTTSTSTAKSATIDMKKGANYVLTFASRVDFSDDRSIRKALGASSQNMTLAGNSGTITLEDLAAKSKQPVIAANLNGNVTITLDNMTPIADDIEYTKVTAKGDRMTFNRETRTIRIEGNVEGTYRKLRKSQGDDPVTNTELRSDYVEIVLTEDFGKVKTVSGGKGSARTGGGG